MKVSTMSYTSTGLVCGGMIEPVVSPAMVELTEVPTWYLSQQHVWLAVQLTGVLGAAGAVANTQAWQLLVLQHAAEQSA